MTRQEAIQFGAKHYFTGIPCKHGHVAKRATLGGKCVECNLMYQRNGRQHIKSIRTQREQSGQGEAEAPIPLGRAEGG